MSNLPKEKSYRLDIYLQPHWGNLYKKLCQPKSEKGWDKSLREKIRRAKKESSQFGSFSLWGVESLWGRSYYFTEYYDSASGLTMRFQRTIGWPDGKERFCPVDKFEDSGYVFASDCPWPGDELQEEERTAQEKLAIEIGENFICNDTYNELGIQKFFFEEKNCVFWFPLYDIFHFLSMQGWWENNDAIKWPEHIKSQLKELGIGYEEGSFVTEEVRFFSMKLKTFRPEENDRFKN